MAYMSQDHKKELAPKIKEICKKHGVKASLGVHHHSTLVLTIKSGKIDFAKDSFSERTGEARPFNGHEQVNHYHIGAMWKGKAAKFLAEVNKAMHGPKFFDKSDISTDYFHCSHYISINVGRWDTPYVLEK